MKTLIAILTALHVLAHGVFGCCDHGRAGVPTSAANSCCHHLLADGHQGHDHGARQAAHHTTCQGQHDSSCGDVRPAPPAAPQHACVHASCHWLPGNTQVTGSPLQPWAELLLAATITPGDMLLEAGACGLFREPGCDSAPPLRLHLALGKLLV